MKSRAPIAPIAVVGLGGIFPEAPNLDRFWANIAAGVDAAREVPSDRWVLDAARAYDSEVGRADKVYSTRGCFIEDFHLDMRDLDLDPDVVAALDPLFHLALHAGRQAVEDAGLAKDCRERVGVIIGNIALPIDNSSKMAREILGQTFDEVTGSQITTSPGRTHPLNRYVAGLPGGVIAKALGRGGVTPSTHSCRALEFLETYPPRPSDCRPAGVRNTATAIAVSPWPTSSACRDTQAWNRQR